MTQHITITEANALDVPAISIWRDDQLIMWGLGDTLEWDLSEGDPIQFLAADEEHGFSTWPGTTPAPIGVLPANTPDTRFYVALGNFINTTDETIKYHYHVNVKLLDPEGILSAEARKRKVGRTDAGGMWVDPDVENQPKP
jgi:hypothetical protein